MKKFIVLGLGVTGQALLQYFQGQADVQVYGVEDSRSDNFIASQKKYTNSKFKFLTSSEILADFPNVNALILSPGISGNHAVVQKAQSYSIPVLSEIEFASQKLSGKIIAVTGTNGKSTAVTLIYELLKAADLKVSLKGNIGDALITALSEPPSDYYVVEVSSYQLETIQTFKPAISILLNVTADHLDRYPSMDEYALAKGNIFRYQEASDYFIYNADDMYCQRLIKNCAATLLPFSLVVPQTSGGFIDRLEMVIRFKGVESRFSLNDARLKGLHNQENMLVSLLAAKILGIKDEVIQHVLKEFKGLKHRVELVHQFNGIDFFDDSKGTNVGSTVMALASFKKNVILILGGKDKGGDYSPLLPLIQSKCKAVFVMGEAKNIILKALKNISFVSSHENMQEVVAAAKEKAEPGDTVLLSPACSSFDQYKNYAERGDDFKNRVKKEFGEAHA